MDAASWAYIYTDKIKAERNGEEPDLKEAPVPASVPKLPDLERRRLRVKEPGHVDDRQLVALVLADDDAVEDLLGPDVILRDLLAGVGERRRRGIRVISSLWTILS